MEKIRTALLLACVLLLASIAREAYVIRGVLTGQYAVDSETVTTGYKSHAEVMALGCAGYRFAGMSDGALRYERINTARASVSVAESSREAEARRVKRILDGPGDR